MRWAGNVAWIGDIRNACNILVGKLGRKRRRRRPWRETEDNIRIAHRKIGWEVVDWIHLAKDRDQ